MRFRKTETYLILGWYLTIGILLRYSVDKEKQIAKPDTVTVNIVREGNEILIYEHYSGELVFEDNKNKEMDRNASQEYLDLYNEIVSYKR